ncbi:MAG: porin family protein [Epsilonproteobacteria bacterium]|nr:MAG: porin family protein [Campylobacterota bacterium]
MKKVIPILVAMAAISNLGFAGGDIEPVEAVVVVEKEVYPFYVGVGLSFVSTRYSSVSLGFFDDKSGEDDTGDILLMAGYEFNPYIALEGRYMSSFTGEDSLTRDSWGVYVKPQYPVNDKFSVYALLGYGGMTVDGKDNGLIPVVVDESGFQWGLGASYDLNVHFSIFIDYVNIANDMDTNILVGSTFEKVDSDALSMGVTYHF